MVFGVIAALEAILLLVAVVALRHEKRSKEFWVGMSESWKVLAGDWRGQAERVLRENGRLLTSIAAIAAATVDPREVPPQEKLN